jgi:trehalose/maltose hydrolase-like predicted phosphorylase
MPSVSHIQKLNIKNGVHNRETVFSVDGVNITLKAERFLSMTMENIMALKYSIVADKDISVTVKTGIDKNVWSISGNHLNYLEEEAFENMSAGLQSTVAGMNSEEAIDKLSEAIECVEEAIECIEEII